MHAEISINEVDLPHRPIQKPPTHALRWSGVWSVVLHCGVAGVLVIGHFATPPVKQTTLSDPINARLYFPPLVKPPAPEPQAVPEQPTSAVVEKAQEEPIEEVEAQPTIASVEPAEQIESLPTTSETNTEPQTQSSILTQSKLAAEGYFRKYQANQNQQLAAEAAQQHRQLTLSPVLEGRPTENDPAELEVKAVDCSSAVSKTIATLSSFTGGRLRCSDRSQFEQHVNKRIQENR